MEVEVKPHIVRDVVDKKEMRAPQYKIFVDDTAVGIIGFHDGASPLLFERYAPMELEEIEKKVRRKLIPQKVGQIRQVGEMPTIKKPVSTARADFE